MEANAKVVAKPVVDVSHHTRANCTSRLPNKENACPPKITENFDIDLCGCTSFTVWPMML